MSNNVKWHLNQLDALRGLAILGVLLVHSISFGSIQLNLGHATYTNVVLSGQRGVQLFFIVSAFTLALSHSKRRRERNPVINYVIRRIFRLTPMLWVATVLALWIWPQSTNTWTNLALKLTYLAGFVPNAIDAGAIGSWSVATEAAFYFALPFLLTFIKTTQSALKALLLTSLLVATIIPTLIRHVGNPDYWYFKSIFPNVPVFLMGIASYEIWKRFVRDRTVSEADARTASLAFFVLAIVLYVNALPFVLERVVGQSVPLALLTLALLLHPWKWLVNKATIGLGKVSYSFYLLHFYVFHLTDSGIQTLGVNHSWLASPKIQFFLKFSVTFALTLPLAVLTYRWVEEPGRRLGNKLIAWLERTGETKKPSSAEQPSEAP